MYVCFWHNGIAWRGGGELLTFKHEAFVILTITIIDFWSSASVFFPWMVKVAIGLPSILETKCVKRTSSIDQFYLELPNIQSLCVILSNILNLWIQKLSQILTSKIQVVNTFCCLYRIFHNIFRTFSRVFLLTLKYSWNTSRL